MSFKPGKFARQEPSRRAIRDQTRTRFFDELGVTPVTDVLARDVDLAAQAKLVSALLEAALSQQSKDISALQQLKQQMNLLDLGSSTVPCGRRTAPDATGLSIGRLSRDFFYTYRY